jgi:hypothetical protein
MGSVRRKGRCSKNQQEENEMTTDAHRCRVCGKLSEDDDGGMVRVGVRRWKHFRRLRLIGVDAILKTVSVQECKPLDQTTLVALDLQTVAVGLMSTRDWPTRSATASRRSAISHARSAWRRAKPCSPMSRALGEETEKADHDRSKRLDKRQAALSSAGARHDARPVSRTSRGAALRDASSRRPLSARPILSGASESVRWAQHAPRLSLRSRSGLALSHARQRR